jgi:ABC-type polysaccharide/polyol phosphate transport system ATPase subunit
MKNAAIRFDRVWKKFRRGERHDSLRDAVPAMFRRWARPRPPTELTDAEFWALKDVTFDVQPGEALGIIGPNGAGKSTALKLLTRILRPTTGNCSVRGRVGALIEVSAGFHPDLTGRENLFLQGAIMGMTRREMARKLDAIVDFAGIGDFIDTQVKRYSSGMNARLGFAVAAHVEPEVLLIDEVLAVGDFRFQQKCYQRLADFRQSGAAIAFVSHNMQAIASLCDRAVLLRPNRPPVIGDVSEVAALYASVDGVASDPRVAVRAFTLREGHQPAALRSPVKPGANLVLDVELEATDTLPRCSLGFEVMRSDGLIVFNGSPMVDGGPTADLTPGARLRFHVEFRANVLRGTYSINLHLSDVQKMWLPIVLSGFGSFVVHETTRVAGCAELEPQYQLTVSTEAPPVRLVGQGV